MQAPDGAILKAWGWQLRLYADSDREVWAGYSTGGKTSLHCHARHNQSIQVLLGSMAFSYDFGEGHHTVNLRHADLENEWWIPSLWKHQLTFEPGCLFLETYRKEGDNCPPVTEDTIREGV